MDRLVDRRLSRRRFLAATAAGGAAVLAGGSASLAAPPPGPNRRVADEDAAWFEASIPELQALMASGELSSRQLTQAYLRRIAALDPTLHSVIETNPQAIGIAAQRDAERRRGKVRGPLHGIPILLKDNIATADRMETTAGSLALVGSRVPRDATLVAGLRKAGAVILGKTNLSEWANFRGFVPEAVIEQGLFLNGWSAGAGSRAIPTSSPGTRADRAQARASHRPRTCVQSRSARRPTVRSSARPATTASSGSSPRSAWSRRTGSSRSRTARTRRGPWVGP